MTAIERRAEIMRILAARRRETAPNLAFELGVTDRTIRNDITVLSVDYPLETVRGNGGCVKVSDWYYPHKHILSREQETVLTELLEMVNAPSHRKALTEILAAFGSPSARENARRSGF